MKLGLSARILLLGLLNVILIAAAATVFLRIQFGTGWGSLLTYASDDRIISMAREVALELAQAPRHDRVSVLGRYSDQYRTPLYLFLNDGTQLAGPAVNLPGEVLAELSRGPEEPFRPPPMLTKSGKGHARGGPGPMFHVDTPNGGARWLGVRVPVASAESNRPERGTLLLQADGFGGGSLFFDPWPWLWLTFSIALIAVLCWAPFLRGLTRSLKRLTAATAEVAEGRFDVDVVDVKEVRRDEVGELSASISRMADRLSLLVQGQKRFLGDAAHELCAPIARIQVGLGVLEQQLPKEALDDLRDDVAEISKLVAEILQFSKASLQSPGDNLEPVDLTGLARSVVAREGAQVEIQIDPGLIATANIALLDRALGNLVRNAVRYAGSTGPITISGMRAGEFVTLVVADHGPGLPEAELERVFAPFYRTELSRSRESGGHGLGLSIVKACVEACNGGVSCRNRTPRGLEVVIKLHS